MEEEKAGGAGSGEVARVSPSFDAVGGRQRFTVELRPGETTIVSWKKLAKDASKVKGSKSAPEQTPSIPLPALESRIAPGEPAENEVKDENPANHRFSAVIEKIERLYMGKHSSDEEDLNDVPDDDEYDTEDSFIDDTELDEYFQVDNSAIKHNGFFVNRGKLERINEPISSPHEQPKKRRKKDLAKGCGENSDGNLTNRPAKVGKKAAGRSLPLAGKNSFSHSQSITGPVEHSDDVKFHNQMNAAVISSKKKSGYNKTTLDPSFSKVSNGDAALSLVGEKDIDMQKTGVLLSKNYINKLKDASEFNDPSYQRSHEKSTLAQVKPQSGRLSNNVDGLEQVVLRKEKNGILEQPEINVPEGKYSMQTTAPVMHRREGSSVRPKSTTLEKAIKELEKMVVESARPPTMEVPDADTSSQAVKRRLPHEVKQKLAKVARLAQASHGKISKELLNRLMGILGNSIQLRTLKRNLKVMVTMDLSAKQENEGRFQQIKKEVVEMIKVRVLSPKPKAIEQQAGVSDDFQEIGNQEKEERKCGMDDALEEKICDLYDLYVEGLDEDAGPQVRKLYAELAELWPNGLMNNHGIKRAIVRAKDRRRALYSRQKDQEKIRRKKLLTPKTEETIQVEASCIPQPQYMQEKLVTDSGNLGITSLNRPVANTTSIATRIPSTLVNDPGLNLPKQEVVKGGNSGNSSDTRTVEALTKKKVKRKPELDVGEAHFRPEKLTSAQGEERHKSNKQFSGLLQKPNLQSAPPPPPPPPPPPSFEQQG
ncbi:ubinuclein-1-like isoform X3 [Cornus florida]|uniref:ubinuclein-1-like isoform X3 n=1 Tax=Cornus florida TaxID=4283 RepID=UPI0028A2259A|nr:ubinuclein-1-like isoform X3 [Cornus florida]